MFQRARVLLKAHADSGVAAIGLAAIADRLAREFPTVGRPQIIDTVARLAVEMGMSMEFGPKPRATDMA
jgi:hypothetical protein